MWIQTVAWWLPFLCFSFLGGQNKVYELRVENQLTVPIRIVSAHLASQVTGETTLYVKAENIGRLPVKEFTISIPDVGSYRLGYPLKPGEAKEINAPISAKMEGLIQQGEVRSWTVSLTHLEWTEDAGVAIPINLSTRVRTSLGVKVAAPKDGIYFPQEHGAPALLCALE